MNQLNVSLQHSIATLAAKGWSARKIARELGVHRETVGHNLRDTGQRESTNAERICQSINVTLSLTDTIFHDESGCGVALLALPLVFW